MAGEKTEKATPKRKQDERKKGNVFLSQEIVTVFTLLAVFFTLKALMPFILSTLEDSIGHYTALGAEVSEVTEDSVKDYLIDSAIVFAKTAIIPLLVCSLVAAIATMAQTKGLVSMKAASFKFERINPISGFKKLFSARSVVELLKSLLKIVVVLYVVYTVIKKEIYIMPRMMDMSFIGAVSKTGDIIMDIVLKVGLIFVAIAVADYVYQWWEYEKNLRMSKQEIKDEYKQTEGDPQIKGRIKNMQQQRARQRMMQAVPEADVVIRNPTHFAVAVKYEPSKNRAPVVVAKGQDSLALRIVAVAEENNVFVTENKPLARALYSGVELGEEIPEQFYKAIAEVLAYVYSLRKKELRNDS